MHAILKIIVSICVALAVGSWQNFAMEQQFDESSFIDALVKADSYANFQAINQAWPVSREDGFYCSLYVALRFDEDKFIDTLCYIDEKYRINAFDDISRLRTLESALRNAFYLACRYQQRYCYSIAILLAKLMPISVRDINPDPNLPRGNTLMHCAAQWATGGLLQWLVSFLSADINVIDAEGKTPLHYAVIAGSLSAVQFLCSQETIDPEIYDYSGYTPLHYVHKIRGKDAKDIVDILLRAGADINKCTQSDKITLLHLAIGNKNIFLVKHLLNYFSIKVNASNRDNVTPLELAVSMKALLKNVDETQERKEEIETIIEMIKLLLQHPFIDATRPLLHNMSPLSVAVVINDEFGIKKLLCHPDIDVNNCDDTGNTPLHNAVKAPQGMKNSVELLLRHNTMQIDQENNDKLRPFDLAILNYLTKPDLRNDISEIIALLLRYDAEPEFIHSETQNTIKEIFPTNFFKIIISKNDHLAVLKDMEKEDGWNIDQRDQYGTTLLMYVAARGDLPAVKFLLKQRADPLALDRYSNSALSLVKTILPQKYYELDITSNADSKKNIALDIEDYEKIAALLQAAQIEAVTTTDDVITLNYPTKARAKRRLDDDVTGPAAKKVKTNEEEAISIPKNFSCFDLLPAALTFSIIQMNSK